METRQYVVGDQITMRLMRREKGSLIALPSTQWVKVEEPIRFGGNCVCVGGGGVRQGAITFLLVQKDMGSKSVDGIKPCNHV